MIGSLPTRHGAPGAKKPVSAVIAYLPRITLAACLIVGSYFLWALTSGGGSHGPAHAHLTSLLRFGNDQAAEAMAVVQTMLQAAGSDKGRPPLTPEGFTEYSKLRQELYCRDSAPLDKPKGRTTYLGDPLNSVMIEINPMPVYITVYGAGQDYVSAAILGGSQWEGTDLQEVMWALKAPLPAGAGPTSKTTPALFVDIGANIGAFTFNVAAAGFEVIAIEGMGANQRLMRNSLCASHPSIMERVTLHGFGLGAARETCYLFADPTNRGDGIPQCGAHNESHAHQLFGPRPPWHYSIRGTMDIETLSDVVDTDVKVMKMDVEGFEPYVIEGAMKLFTEHTVWFLIMEYNKPMLSDILKTRPEVNRVDFVLKLVKVGYRISLQSFKGPFLNTEQEIIDMDAAAEPSNTNIYFVHKKFTTT